MITIFIIHLVIHGHSGQLNSLSAGSKELSHPYSSVPSEHLTSKVRHFKL